MQLRVCGVDERGSDFFVSLITSLYQFTKEGTGALNFGQLK